MDPNYALKKQKPHRSLDIHANVVKEEVDKLKEVRAIKEVLYIYIYIYPEWVANTMMVKKKNGKWCVCVDFMDLNKACLKDPFSMPKIDQLVNATFGHPILSFLDAFQGYHQIALAPENKENTSFITPMGNYHYKVMPFKLKNARSTYRG